MASASLYDQAREVERQAGAILSAFDVSELPAVQRDVTAALKHQLIDARLAVREYEYAQTRAEQLVAAKEAQLFLRQAGESIVKISQYGLFGAVDVAQLSARIDLIISQIT